MKKIKLEYIFTFVFVCLMVAVAELSHEKEIIFPEITALTIGAWLAPKMVWRTSKRKAVFLIALMAMSGVLFVRYVPLWLPLKVCLAFIWCDICLIASKTSFAPLISACILQILLETTSWIYPLSATIMATLGMLGLTLFEKLGLKETSAYDPIRYDRKTDTMLWLQ